MKRIISFLKAVEGDVFKILPMKESYDKGSENHLYDYIDSLIINLRGGTIEYPELAGSKKYLYVINNLQYIRNNTVDFVQWRRVILGATKEVNDLYKEYKGANTHAK